MASQEDYLDNLLKNMLGNGEEPDNIHKAAGDFLSVETAAEDLLSEPDFFGEAETPAEDLLTEPDPFGEAETAEDFLSVETPAEDLLSEPDPFGEAETAGDFLSADNGDSEEGIFGTMDEMLSDEDVLKMLADSDGDNVGGLPDLTEKLGNDGDISGLGGFDETTDDIFGTTAENTSRAGQEKAGNLGATSGENEKETVEEKKESPAQKRERKKAEAAARKAAKQAAREAARQEKAEKKAQKPEKKTTARADETVEAAGMKAQAEGDLMDMSLLDSILSEANIIEKKPEPREEAEDQPEFLDINMEEPMDFNFGEAEPAQSKENDLGIDLDSMFPDTGIDLTGEDSFGFGDTLELDMEEADQLIPERNAAADGGKKSEKKKPLFSRFRDFLMEEDEEENEENHFFQDEQDAKGGSEGKSGGDKKSKKGGTPKKEKGKPKKDAKPKKPAKPKKAPAPKKGKAPKESSPNNEKKLSFKKILPVLLIGASVGVLLFLFVNAATVYSDRSNARTAFYRGDYDTCYQNLKGKKLDETESIMFGKSESILYSRLWIREYEVFTESGDDVRALDSLIQAIVYYPELQEHAARWNALSEVAAGYAEVLNLLESKFGLTESQAKEIALQRRDVDYTRMITAIAGKQSPEKESGAGTFGSQKTPDTPKGSDEPSGTSAADDSQSMADPLPEEEGLGDSDFIEN